MRRLLFVLIAACAASAQVKIRTERDVVCLARDGVKLRADVYRPDDGDTYPVLLARTPYGKQGVNGEGKARRGYVVVVQDTRGRGRSEGRFDPFMDDERDGYDAVEWAARLPGSNGKVGMFGGSYGGATQVFAAMASPPHLVAFFPVFPAIGYGTHNILFEGGAFRQLLASSWAAAQTIELYGRAVGRAGGSRQEFEALLNAGPAAGFMETMFRRSMEWGGGGWYREWLAHAPGSEYWRRTNMAGKVKGIKAAGCYVAGVYDIFGPATAALFSAVRKDGGSEEARRGSQLWWGPWTHGGSKMKPGDTGFGTEPQVSYGKYEDAWFDYWLKGVATEASKTAPARVFVTGENRWHGEDQFPPVRAAVREFALAKETVLLGGAAPPSESRWVSDPASPVPTLGGKLCCHPGFMPGTFDHAALAARTDVAVFTSGPVRTPLRVMGPGDLAARVRVDAPDADLVVKLMEVTPDGKSVVLADGVLRLRYRGGEDREQFMKAGKPENVTVALGPVTHQFAAGTRIRLFVAASDFPNSSVNPQTNEPVASAKGKRKATISLFHGGAEGSRLRLRVLD